MGMSISFKKATNKTNIKHNNRTMNDKEKDKNSHIDFSLSDENKYLVQESLKKLYEKEFGEALEKYNEKQKRSDRKIENYYKHIQDSKKTSLQQEMIIQVGEKEDFSSKENREQANAILQEWFNDFQERNPSLKIYNAVIHNDEASPHMHLNFVPVAEGYKRGLEKQVSFDRAIQQDDPALRKDRPFEAWREKEVGLLEEKLQERGIERKFVGTNDYKDVNELKEKKDELKALQKEIDVLEGQLDGVKSVSEIDTKVKGGRFTNKVTISKDDFEEIKNVAKAGILLNEKIDDLRASNSFEVQKLEKDLKQAENERNEVMDTNEKLLKENQELKKENNFLKEVLDKVKIAFKDKVQYIGASIGQIKAIALDRMGEGLKEKYIADDDERLGAEKTMEILEKRKEQKKEEELEL